jgi:HAD superfamily hydrolase (TIGR01549 family)
MKYKAVIFDLGSTLINYENHSWDELGLMGCRNAAPLLKQIADIEIPPEKLRSEFHIIIDQMFLNHSEDLKEIDLREVTSLILERLGVAFVDGLSSRFIDAYYQPITDQASLVEGADEILSKIKSAGIKIGLISNTIFPPAYHRQEMRRFGLYDYFNFTIFSSDVGIRKPKREIFLRAMKLAGSTPETTVFVGDRLAEDVGGPQSLGIRAVLKVTEGRDYSLPIAPFATIHHLRELEKIILS